jgi:hypothetical protein
MLLHRNTLSLALSLTFSPVQQKRIRRFLNFRFLFPYDNHFFGGVFGLLISVARGFLALSGPALISAHRGLALLWKR